MLELPNFHKTLAQLELASSDPPIDTRLAALNKMQAETEKALESSQVSKEAKQLIECVIKIDQGFERVKIDLGGVDDGRFRNKPIEKLQPQWEAYQHFVNVILPTLENLKGNAEYKDAAADLREFAARKSPFEYHLDSSLDNKHSQAFVELRYDIKVFRDSFEFFLEEQQIELDADIVRLQEEISELNWQIKRCRVMNSAIGKALAVTLSVSEIGSMAAISALALFCPTTALSIFLSGAVDAVPEYKDVAAYISGTNGN
ncbi:hypothetical protein H0H87_005777 [Tephrocybe sp. NHM501043]|nr:hypothetical protein H0H87_005777 [Tephrocybe sp. NHM501043]